MKNLLLILTTILLFSSCAREQIPVTNKEKATTIELQKLADKDTILYKVVIVEDDLYYINSKTKLVEGTVCNYAAGVNTLRLLASISLIIIFVIICAIAFE